MLPEDDYSENLYKFSVPVEDLIRIYCLYIRSIAKQSSVVWSSSLTQGQEYDWERIQKVAQHIILGEEYVSYENARAITKLKNLKQRQLDRSLNLH